MAIIGKAAILAKIEGKRKARKAIESASRVSDLSAKERNSAIRSARSKLISRSNKAEKAGDIATANRLRNLSNELKISNIRQSVGENPKSRKALSTSAQDRLNYLYGNARKEIFYNPGTKAGKNKLAIYRTLERQIAVMSHQLGWWSGEDVASDSVTKRILENVERVKNIPSGKSTIDDVINYFVDEEDKIRQELADYTGNQNWVDPDYIPRSGFVFSHYKQFEK